MGRHKVRIIKRYDKKQIIEHLEDGYVGNSECGYKKVKIGNRDITLTRLCFKNKKKN